MGLIGNSSELKLHDLVQLKAMSRGTCRILVQGSRGPGVLYVSGAEVVHAEYAGMLGVPAASALLAEDRVEYRATSDVEVPAPTMRMDATNLLLQAAVAVDEERRATSSRALAARPASSAPARAAAPRAPRRRSVLAAAAGAVLVAAAVGIAAFARITVGPSEAVAMPPAPPAPGAGPAAPPRREPVEASRLVGAHDALPVLVAGDPPRTPAPGTALRPTVIVRLLVDESGKVARAEVYQPRAELAEFERAAVGTVRAYRFHPARREGQAVATWINWPVDFI